MNESNIQALADAISGLVDIDKLAVKVSERIERPGISELGISKIAEAVVVKLPLCLKERLTTEEAAIYLGLSVKQVRKLANEGKIECYKPGGKLRYYERANLDAWMCGNRVATKEETNDAATAHCLRNKMPQK